MKRHSHRYLTEQQGLGSTKCRMRPSRECNKGAESLIPPLIPDRLGLFVVEPFSASVRNLPNASSRILADEPVASHVAGLPSNTVLPTDVIRRWQFLVISLGQNFLHFLTNALNDFLSPSSSAQLNERL